MTTFPASPPERHCRRCGDTANLRMIPGLLGPNEWQCWESCELREGASDGAFEDAFARIADRFAMCDGGEQS
jgi:hypothetical protein